MWLFSPKQSKDLSAEPETSDRNINGNEGGVLTGKENHPGILELREKHHDMENKINELRELSRKRDSELQSIKETIRDCKEKVATLRQSFGDNGSKSLSLGNIRFALASLNLRHPGTWKMIGGAVLLLYLLSMNPCFFLVPKIPSLYGFLYVVTIFYHFVLVTGVPLIRRFAVRMGLEEGAVAFFEAALAPWSNAIGAGLCALALMLLKLKRCVPKGCCGAYFQMLMIILAFFVELGAYCYAENPQQPLRGSQSNDVSRGPIVNYAIAGLQGLNIVVSISAR